MSLGQITRRRVTLWLPFVPLGLLLVTMAGARSLEQQPTFCASCHEERISYETWLLSGAAEEHPTCIECHSAPGLYGVLNAQARGVLHVAKHITGQFTEPLQGTVPQAWCVKCHTDDIGLQREHEGISRFVSTSCAECHNHRPGVRFNGKEGSQRSDYEGPEAEEGEE